MNKEGHLALLALPFKVFVICCFWFILAYRKLVSEGHFDTLWAGTAIAAYVVSFWVLVAIGFVQRRKKFRGAQMTLMCAIVAFLFILLLIPYLAH